MKRRNFFKCLAAAAASIVPLAATKPSEDELYKLKEKKLQELKMQIIKKNPMITGIHPTNWKGIPPNLYQQSPDATFTCNTNKYHFIAGGRNNTVTSNTWTFS
jgi:hypothetical protein